MGDELSFRVSFRLNGKAARAFLEEQSRILRLTGSAVQSAKSTLGEAAAIEFLNRRGYDVPKSSTNWGGRREEPETVTVQQEVQA